jgi:hypothetical protein
VSWPAPQPGLVVRFSYLWKREADAGREEGAKDRPCAVVIAIEGAEGHSRVIVLPITHFPPRPPDEGVELPRQTKTRLGLDDERSWVIVSEANDFTWPGPDLRFPPGQGPESIAYGFLPPLVFRAVRDRFLARYQRRQVGLVTRTE